MATVESVTGPLGADDLGVTLIHEHLKFRDEANHYTFPHLYDEDAIYATGLEAANAALGVGVKTICEPTAMFGDRNIAFLERAAKESGLQVIACTGIYTYEHLPLYWQSRDADAMADAFVHDIEQGIQGTSIKAGFLKCAADAAGVNENVEKVHRACARASLRTGAPIMAHSRPASQTGPRQVEIFLEEGVDPGKIQIAHCGDTDDVGYIEGLIEQGVWAGLDRYGIEMYLPFDKRNATTLALLEKGYADRVFLGADSVATLDWFPDEQVEQLMAAGAVKDWTITLVHDQVVPFLLENGATEDQMTTIFEENPKGWLGLA
jgi:phosphotriesterase-related protein